MRTELHLHIEGTLGPELAFELANRNRVELPFADVEDLRRRYDFADLQSFLDLYYACMTVLRAPDDFRDFALTYLDRAAGDGIAHVEMFFDPQVHARNGVPVGNVIDGLLEALHIAEKQHGITGGLIMSFVRDLPVESAMALLESVAALFVGSVAFVASIAVVMMLVQAFDAVIGPVDKDRMKTVGPASRRC